MITDEETIASLQKATACYPMDTDIRLATSDALCDMGRYATSAKWLREPSRFDVSWYGYGDGYGDGHGRGDGIGYGNGSGYGRGDGLGYADGYGNGYGYGFGDGYGGGYGDGYGDGNNDNECKTPIDLGEEYIVEGKQILVFCGRGFAWVGRVTTQWSPGCWQLEDAGMLCQTGAASWLEIAGGQGRNGMIYRRAADGVVYLGPEIHGAMNWVGDLPSADVG